MFRIIYLFALIGSLFVPGFGLGAGFVCETVTGLRIEVEHTLPVPGRPTRTTRMKIIDGDVTLIDRTQRDIQRFREGNVFNYLVRGGENFPVSVVMLQIEFPGWRDYLTERESAEGHFRVRKGTVWEDIHADCQGRQIDWDLEAEAH